MNMFRYFKKKLFKNTEGKYLLSILTRKHEITKKHFDVIDSTKLV